MNHLEPTTSRTILEAIEKENAELANDIRNLMFTFEDLVGIPETALRDWLAAVDKKTLGLALKGASEQVRDHIFKAMSSRAVEMMKEDIEALGRVRSKEVTKAQQEVAAIARTLEPRATAPDPPGVHLRIPGLDLRQGRAPRRGSGSPIRHRRSSACTSRVTPLLAFWQRHLGRSPLRRAGQRESTVREPER